MNEILVIQSYLDFSNQNYFQKDILRGEIFD